MKNSPKFDQGQLSNIKFVLGGNVTPLKSCFNDDEIALAFLKKIENFLQEDANHNQDAKSKFIDEVTGIFGDDSAKKFLIEGLNTDKLIELTANTIELATGTHKVILEAKKSREENDYNPILFKEGKTIDQVAIEITRNLLTQSITELKDKIDSKGQILAKLESKSNIEGSELSNLRKLIGAVRIAVVEKVGEQVANQIKEV